MGRLTILAGGLRSVQSDRVLGRSIIISVVGR